MKIVRFTHEFRGRKYKVAMSRPGPGSEGECAPPQAPARDRTLHINPVNMEEFLDTAIHEALHACLWDLSEQATADTSRSISSFLHRLGFRFVPPVQGPPDADTVPLGARSAQTKRPQAKKT